MLTFSFVTDGNSFRHNFSCCGQEAVSNPETDSNQSFHAAWSPPCWLTNHSTADDMESDVCQACRGGWVTYMAANHLPTTCRRNAWWISTSSAPVCCVSVCWWVWVSLARCQSRSSSPHSLSWSVNAPTCGTITDDATAIVWLRLFFPGCTCVSQGLPATGVCVLCQSVHTGELAIMDAITLLSLDSVDCSKAHSTPA